MNIAEKLAQEFGIRLTAVEQTISLIDEGNTIPFIARYRKEVTGGLSDVVLRDLDERLNYLRGLEERKAEVIKLIEEQGKLTEELKSEIEKAEILQRVEDLYKPFKQKKSTRASKAREKGLEPLAESIWAQDRQSGDLLKDAEVYVDPDRGVNTPEDALAGACDILPKLQIWCVLLRERPAFSHRKPQIPMRGRYMICIMNTRRVSLKFPIIVCWPSTGGKKRKN